MAFTMNTLSAISPNGGSGSTLFTYKTNDTQANIVAANYFNDAVSKLKLGSIILAAVDQDGTPDGVGLVVTANDGTTVTVGYIAVA